MLNDSVDEVYKKIYHFGIDYAFSYIKEKEKIKKIGGGNGN
jgi:hypothetical protein